MRTHFASTLTWQKAIAYISLLTALLTFGFIATGVWSGRSFAIDSKAFALATHLRSPLTDQFFLFITFLGSSQFLLPANILLIATALWQLRKKLVAFKIAAIAISSLLFMYIFKNIFKRSRPEDFLIDSAKGFSFPSGHTLNSLVFFGLLLYFLKQSDVPKGKLIFFFLFFGLMVFLIGFSRIYLHVHYASDVIAGFSMGIAWLIVALGVTGKNSDE